MAKKKSAKTEASSPARPEASPEGYEQLLGDLKDRIRQAQLRASLSVNRELVLLYWGLGRDILARQERQGWGAKVIDRLAADLRRAFPEMSGFSPRNLKYMRSFAASWPDGAIVQAALAQITWYHNVTLVEKLKDPEERLWYAHAAVKNGWSRNVLVLQIESSLFRRQGKALTNFEATLPGVQSDLAQQLLRDSYNFAFLTLGDDALERGLVVLGDGSRVLVENSEALSLEVLAIAEQILERQQSIDE